MSLIKDCVLDVASQYGGASPGLVTTYDKSRYKATGTLTSVTWTQLGDGVWAATQNAITDGCLWGYNPQNAIIRMTLEVWLMVPALPVAASTPGVIGVWDINALRSYAIYLDDTGNVIFARSSDGAYNVGELLTSATVLTVNTWKHIMCVQDGTNAYIYFDGAEDTNGAHVANYVSTGQFSTGCYTNAGAIEGGLIGQYFGARAFNYAFTPAQIRARYHAEKYTAGVPV